MSVYDEEYIYKAMTDMFKLKNSYRQSVLGWKNSINTFSEKESQ